MERRRFLGALTAASSGVALDVSLTKFAGAQNTANQTERTYRLPRDASHEAVQGNIIADFPVINKSFNLSYSGTDR